MPETSRAKKASSSSGEDRISNLPDDVLQHILGFLPADQAVETCVLARRWRHLWKSMRRLCIRPNVWLSAGGFNKFMNCLLLLRDPGVALDEIWFEGRRGFTPFEECDTTFYHIWIRHALLCQAQVLSVYYLPYEPEDDCPELQGPPPVSRHLRRLELTDMELKGSFLDISSCPALEVLKISECFLDTAGILSQSVKHLSIEESCLRRDTRIRISAPSLISLELVRFGGRAPVLESMPSLETACIRPDGMTDYCDSTDDSTECCGACANCCGNDDHRGGCVLFDGLSSATNLELITIFRKQTIFRRDLKWCPTFSKLKTLLLNDWWVQADLCALVCILEHSPILENLTLQLHKANPHMLETEENHGWMEKSTAISKHLKIVKVRCEEVDEGVWKVLKFLSTLDIEILIKRTNG